MSGNREKRVLHLPLKRVFFDQIVAGHKHIEYRDVKPHWNSRIAGKEFDEIHFRNGFAKDAPFMRVKCLGWSLDTFAGKRVYALQLGPILELKNHPAAKEPARGSDDA